MSEWSEYKIARAIALQTLARKCVVLVDNCNWTGRECDVLGITTDLRIIDIEVKISRADLKADAKKDKWWSRTFVGYGPREEIMGANGRLQMVRQPHIYNSTALLHPPKVWKHYYAMPRSIWKPELIEFLPSKASGILLLDVSGYPRRVDADMRVECIRRATPARDAYRLTPAQAIDVARLANLRMWEAYRRRDASQSDSSRWQQQVMAMTGAV